MSRARKTNSLVTVAALIFCVAGVAAPRSALALEAGDWLIRVGASHVSPGVDSEPTALGATTGVDADGDTELSFTVGCMLTERWGVELLGALPFEHDIDAVGSIASLGTVGTTNTCRRY